MKDDRVYLRHILECLDAIHAYTAEGRDRFRTDRKTQKATLRELQEVAESTQRISPHLKERHPEIPRGGYHRVQKCPRPRLSGDQPITDLDRG
jgi:uncharacterized protein with HEPN domain